MGKDYGPWVRLDWCPRCARSIEQTRWFHRLLGMPAEHSERRARCHECQAEFRAAAAG